MKLGSHFDCISDSDLLLRLLPLGRDRQGQSLGAGNLQQLCFKVKAVRWVH